MLDSDFGRMTARMALGSGFWIFDGKFQLIEMPKKPIIIISVLCIIALALGYWSGQGKEEVASNSIKSSEKKSLSFLKKVWSLIIPLMEVLKMKVGMATMVEVVLLPFPLIETAA